MPSSPASPTSPSWISFSPDAPLTPTPGDKAAHRSASIRSYTRPKAPAYAAPPSRIPRLDSPPRRVDSVSDSIADETPPWQDHERVNLGTFAKGVHPLIASTKLADVAPKSPQGAARDRVPGFLASTAPLSSPTSSSSSESEESPLSSSSAPSSTPSSPTKSSHPSATDGNFNILSGPFDDLDELESTETFTFSPYAWGGLSPKERPVLSTFDSLEAGGDVAGGAWEDELYSALADRLTPTTPSKSPRHAYYTHRTSPRSPTRSRRGSIVVASRRPSSAALIYSPATPRRSSHIITFPPPKVPVEGDTLTRTPRRPSHVACTRSSDAAAKKAAKKAKKAAQKAADKVPRLLTTNQLLDEFFGGPCATGKALRGGYAGMGVEAEELTEFNPLLREDEDEDEDEDDAFNSSEAAQGSYKTAREDVVDSDPTAPGLKRLNRPPPLDLSRALANPAIANVEISSAKTIATPGYVSSPDPLSKEIRRRASETALRSAKALDGSAGSSKRLQRKKSVVDVLKTAWASLVEGGGQEKAKKAAAWASLVESGAQEKARDQAAGLIV